MTTEVFFAAAAMSCFLALIVLLVRDMYRARGHDRYWASRPTFTDRMLYGERWETFRPDLSWDRHVDQALEAAEPTPDLRRLK